MLSLVRMLCQWHLVKIVRLLFTALLCVYFLKVFSIHEYLRFETSENQDSNNLVLYSPVWGLHQQRFPFLANLHMKSFWICFWMMYSMCLLFPSCILWQWTLFWQQQQQSFERHYNTQSLSFLSCDGRVGWQWIFVCLLTFTDIIMKILYLTFKRLSWLPLSVYDSKVSEKACSCCCCVICQNGPVMFRAIVLYFIPRIPGASKKLRRSSSYHIHVA